MTTTLKLCITSGLESCSSCWSDTELAQGIDMQPLSFSGFYQGPVCETKKPKKFWIYLGLVSVAP